MKLPTAGQVFRSQVARYVGAVAITLLLLLGAARIGGYTPTRGALAALEPTPADTASQVWGQSCTGTVPGVTTDPFIRTELFFGSAKPDGTAVTDAEFFGFLDREITPRFPDGLTVLSGDGQYRDGTTIIKERSKLVILLYPREDAQEKSAKIEEIRKLFVDEFQQSSVLRADDPRPVCVSF